MEQEQEITLSAQGVFDAIKLLDKDLINKVLAISKLVKIEQLENGTTRIIIDIVNQG